MAKVFIEESTLTKIGNAIRGKTGKTALIDPAVMDVEITNIPSGGDGGLPEEAFSISGDCSYKFAGGGWNWFIETYGNRITTTGITNAECMFYNTKDLKSVPFALNVDKLKLKEAFKNSKVENLPTIHISPTYTIYNDAHLQGLLSGAEKVVDAENLFVPEEVENLFSNTLITGSQGWLQTAMMQEMFYYCYSLRRIPTWWYKMQPNKNSDYLYSAYNLCLYNAFQGCYCLDEATNLPVLQYTANVALTGNILGSTFSSCQRLKNVTFETQPDGTPYTVKWKSQNFNLAYIGYGSAGRSYGLSTDKQVKDDATYQALKNDPDWWTSAKEYGRYNHDSAVATINSLPDTSAYLAEAGGTNTIKFEGISGSLTDGGAINTLTAEEIAVATAKGWTVTLV